MDDQKYMRMALDLAKKGRGWTSPNPMVGAVIVKDGKVIGKGWHQKYRSLHAEREALANCRQSAKDATLYVTLEPCCHHGNQPPCTEAILESGIKEVVVGCLDTNPLVAGKGIEILKNHGILVRNGILEQECRQLNQAFLYWIQTGYPYCALKYAMTLDGKIAAASGESKWITSSKARNQVHLLRHEYAAILVGINTVLKDDPMLNCRLENTKDPIRIVVDTHLRLPLDSQLVQSAKNIPLIAATCQNDSTKIAEYEKAGVTVLICQSKDNQVDLKDLFYQLGQMKINSVLIEGGPAIAASALDQGLVQKVYTYISPKLFGGTHSKSPIGGQGAWYPSDCIKVKGCKVHTIGADFLIEGEIESNVYRDH
ncbi:bifunctional diaminohydroxyphosphoribosylaminopyrimidine deaminase/5-amino-6-(5-phosphoribosylamino)uracil reductase RibD [Ileibacterium valens]|uniref:bifunctional diaminohydroxyphosphoribosylaminopyrimidine deaminase/5-amino-6-(5-phosphoribosylamino)uracil reductase RibD n=1 Tax=Ileibacterium valens TaxID=1862668 RepID=UPI0025B76488|nr:bifunctional diaminohydroxyphosphoribosylaminopyrimidine deaminase/5-amino-6-(5-phosphoribosylamino)uracil reductase RibD [Ileibacterium valens]